ncbi:lactose transport system permease protein LacF [Oceanobacillus picturae]|jgi:N-acetylglucosamine transport system permease protein|uniref:Lactose transport system permease protein LacF n=2 Tax=Oceanobacillus TaxID=182709 RepID=W9AKY6_9BACI|nr:MULTISPECIES: sugar ABC transporter permease [Oceanobacillus]MCG3420283.1 sugar ABC transporter permease [Oceanobacillus jordanicus]RIU91224.1 sugar ABC transporter permease [Oceanobacillus picturae]GAQ16200.1 lactose transport system permease protein LacF [Oceanobacillus picturae]CDO03336.1 Lactose transport system permease protein LacF [Oceanobacillus picturae]
MVQSKKQKYLFLAFCLIPTFILFAIFTLYPLFSGLYYSFFDWSGSSQNKDFVGLANYIKLVKDAIIPNTIIHDYFLVATKVIGIMVMALFFAVALTQLKIKEAPFYRIVFFFPNIMSVVVIGILWTFIYNPNLGLVNSGLEFIGLESLAKPWLGDEDWALPSLVLPSVWAGIGLFMLLLMGGISNVSKSYYEAAELDGASEWQQFWKVTLPLIWPQVKISILYIVITTLNGSFIIVQVMTGGGPNNATHVMGSYLYQQAFVQYNFGYGATIGVMILIISLLTVLILQFIMRRDKVEY